MISLGQFLNLEVVLRALPFFDTAAGFLLEAPFVAAMIGPSERTL